MAINRVRPSKENPSAGYKEPVDRNTDALDAHGVYIQDEVSDDTAVLITRDALGNMTFVDPVIGVTKTLTELAESGSGLTEPQHQALDTLTHQIDENSFDEVIRTNDRISQVITWTTPAKTLKIREVAFTRDGLGRVSQCTWTQYDGAGLIKETLTETLSRSCGRVTSIDRTRTP